MSMQPATPNPTGSATAGISLQDVEEVLKALPVDKLPSAYDYLRFLQQQAEDDEDLAAVDAIKDEPTRPFSEFVTELEREHLYP